MFQEIKTATTFICKLVCIPAHQVEKFQQTLSELLESRFQTHWDSQRPHVGSAYRCVRSEVGKIDPILCQAATLCGIALEKVSVPPCFSVWIDPKDVSARIGATGSIFPVSLEDRSPLSTSPTPSTHRPLSISNPILVQA